MKQWKGTMAKIPTLPARAKENHKLNHREGPAKDNHQASTNYF